MTSGIARACYNFWKNLPAEETIVLAPAAGDWQKFDGEQKFRIYRYAPAFEEMSQPFWKKILRFIAVFIKAAAIIRKEKIDFIHAGQPVLVGRAAYLLSRIFRIPYVIYVYGGEAGKFKDSFLFKIYLANLKKASAVITCSDYTSSEVRKLFPDKEITRIYPGVDTDVYRPGLDAAELRKSLGLDGKRILLTVARLVERKGQNLVIEILKELEREFPDLIYVIVGEGPSRESLEILAGKLKLGKKVFFAGKVKEEELPLFYNLCDIFVMLNIETRNEEVVEGFGISFIEASACGKPVIGGISGGAVEAVKERRTGLTVNPQNREETGEAIRFLLRNPEIGKAMGEAGRRMTVEEFDWRIVSQCFSKYISF